VSERIPTADLIEWARVCSIDGCEKPHRARGMCAGHYNRARRGAPLDAPWANTQRPRGVPEPERFWSFVERGEGCWLWKGGLSGSGYGNFWSDGKTVRAHRYAWEITHGRPVPEGLYVLHRCDTPRCCNPEHLFVGTLRDNSRDMAAKGRVVSTVSNCRCGAFRTNDGAPCKACGDGAEPNHRWREERVAHIGREAA